MSSQPKQSWYELCELAAKEENPEKLLALMLEIDRLLGQKEIYEPAGESCEAA